MYLQEGIIFSQRREHTVMISLLRFRWPMTLILDCMIYLVNFEHNFKNNVTLAPFISTYTSHILGREKRR